ncbi:MAG TPA: hypothetical protein VFX28_20115, partial [Methylomirabilota bacterium]|nr:hypothetical protein [Methylomirabilota bacterium]
MSRRGLAAAVVVVALTLAARPAPAAAPPFTIDVLAAGSKEVALTVPPPGEVTLGLVRTTVGGAPEAVELYLSAFAGEHGDSVPVLAALGAG